MSTYHLNLEDFSETQPPEQAESPDYERGFEAGLAQARAAISAERTVALSTLNATLADMEFGFAEARVLLLQQIRPLLKQVSDSVLPEILKTTFGNHIVDLLEAEFSAELDGPIHISVHPEQHEKVADLFETRTAVSVAFHADPTLRKHSCLITSPTSQRLLNLEDLMHGLQTALGGLDALERNTSHG